MTTVATVNKAVEAHLIRALLEGRGLAAFVRDELGAPSPQPGGTLTAPQNSAASCGNDS